MVFQIEWTPTATLEALARKRGAREDSSPLDYCEAEDASQYVQARTFGEAVALAKTKFAEDYFGSVRVERLVRIKSRQMKDRLDADAIWYIDDTTTDYSEDSPNDYRDVDLFDGEYIAS